MEGLFSLRRRASRHGPRGQPPVTPDRNGGKGNAGGSNRNRENEGITSSGNNLMKRRGSTSSLIPPPFDMTDLGGKENREVCLILFLVSSSHLTPYTAYPHWYSLVSQCAFFNALPLAKMFRTALSSRAYPFLECPWGWSGRSELRSDQLYRSEEYPWLYAPWGKGRCRGSECSSAGTCTGELMMGRRALR